MVRRMHDSTAAPERVRTRFEERAQQFDDLYEDERWLVRTLRPGLFRRRQLPVDTVSSYEAPRVLDVGCGSGRIGEFVLKAGASHYVGVDFSAPMIDLSRARLQRFSAKTELIVDDFLTAPLTGPFEVVLAVGLFDYLPDPHLFSRRMFELTAPGGCVVGSFPTWSAPTGPEHPRRTHMSLLHALGIFGAGIVAGTINTVVGSGTLFTFPILLSFGYAPVTANVTNTVGLVPGSVSGAIGYRRELAGQRERLLRLSVASATGGIVGAILLLSLPAGAFKDIVPAFIVIALALIILQPRLARVMDAYRARRARESGQLGPVSFLSVFVTGIYGGYFGAAQGIMLLAILGLSLPDEDLQRVNAVKVVLAGLVNLIAGIVFVFAAHVVWLAALLLAIGSTIGGVLGARYGRRLPPAGLRALIVVVGVVAIVRLL